MRKDPNTGKRQARPNPPEAWITEEVPHLQIINDDLWQCVKLRQGAIRETILTSDCIIAVADVVEIFCTEAACVI